MMMMMMMILTEPYQQFSFLLSVYSRPLDARFTPSMRRRGQLTCTSSTKAPRKGFSAQLVIEFVEPKQQQKVVLALVVFNLVIFKVIVYQNDGMEIESEV